MKVIANMCDFFPKSQRFYERFDIHGTGRGSDCFYQTSDQWSSCFLIYYYTNKLFNSHIVKTYNQGPSRTQPVL